MVLRRASRPQWFLLGLVGMFRGFLLEFSQNVRFLAVSPLKTMCITSQVVTVLGGTGATRKACHNSPRQADARPLQAPS